jgi:uncharacterized protein (TIGR00369 family)
MSWLGIVFERYEPDDVTIRLPFREVLTNDGTYFHGGVIASVMDTTGAAAAWSNHDFEKGSRARAPRRHHPVRCLVLLHPNRFRRRAD